MNHQKEISNTLSQLGVSKAYAGYKYVVYGTSLVIEDKNCLNLITKSLYIDIASHYNTTWECVERNIRTVILSIWKTQNRELLKTLCGGYINERPTNKEFFLLLADYIISLEKFECTAAEADTVICGKGRVYSCPKDGKVCRFIMLLQDKLLETEKKNTALYEINKKIYELL